MCNLYFNLSSLNRCLKNEGIKMDTILVSPKDSQEFQLISDLFAKMNIKTKVLSSEEKEDLYFGELMKEADRTKKVSRATIMKKLSE